MNTLPRAWIRLPSGSRFDLINPSPDTWKDTDLAIRLARTYRWSGESMWQHPLSVAQHSLTVLALRQQAAGRPLTQAEILMELLHDAEEGFLGFDCISPMKAVLGKPFKEVADRIMGVIATRYDLPAWTADAYASHKDADLVAAASEALHVVGWSVEEVRNVLGIQHAILAEDPLATLYDCEPWKPWPADVAASRFYKVLDTAIARPQEKLVHEPVEYTSMTC